MIKNFSFLEISICINVNTSNIMATNETDFANCSLCFNVKTFRKDVKCTHARHTADTVCQVYENVNDLCRLCFKNVSSSDVEVYSCQSDHSDDCSKYFDVHVDETGKTGTDACAVSKNVNKLVLRNWRYFS